MSSDTNYSNIERPFGDFLERQNDLSVVAGGDINNNIGASDGAGTTTPSDGGVSADTPIKSPQSFSDVWIDSEIRSRDWKPKTFGFYINGQTGYAEFSNIYISGSITATTGTIGGFTVGSDYIRDAANSMGLASTVTGGDDVRFWAGDTFANRATAPFRVTEAGAVTASSFTHSGGTVGSSVVVAIGALNVAARGWTQTSVFSVTDADTVAWGAGTFTSADGTSYSITGSNTGNMAAATYIYLDTAVSTTAYQTTTTAATAVGAGKVLIAKAQNGTGEATFQVFGGIGGQNIDAASIVANSITANELSTSITYAGTIIIDSSGAIRSGQTAYDTGTGFWLGNASGTPKFSIGNASGNKLTWDGTTLGIVGAITGGSITIGSNASIDSSGNATFIGVKSLNKKAFTNFETAARYVTTGASGTGSTTFGNQGVTVATGATATSHQILQWKIGNVLTNNPTFTCTFIAPDPASGSGRAFIGLGSPSVSGSGITYNSSQIGFKINKEGGTTTLVSEVNDGGSGTSQNADLTTLANGDVVEVLLSVTSASVKFYYRKNGGSITLGDTQTTHIPSGSAEDSIYFAVSNAGTAFNYPITLQCAAYEH